MPLLYGPSYTNIILTAVAIILLLAMAGFSWYHSRINGAFHLMVMSLLGATWGLIYLFNLLTSNIEIGLLLSTLQFIPAVFLAPVFLVLAMVFTGRAAAIHKPVWLMLYIIPVFTIGIVASNNYHHLLSAPPAELSGAAQPVYHAWFWVFVAYSILLMLGSLFLLARTYLRLPRWSRSRIGTLMLGAVIIIVAGIFSLPAWLSNAPVNLTLIALLMAIIVIAYSLFSNRMLEVIPLSRSTLLSQLNDAVIILNADHEILDYNAAAASVPVLNPAEHMGESFLKLLENSIPHEVSIDRTADHSEELVLEQGAFSFTYDMRISPLAGDGQKTIGHLVVLRDITRRKQEELERVQIEERYRAILQNAAYGILLVDKEGRIVEANARFCNLSGYPAASLAGVVLSDLVRDPSEINTNLRGKTHPILETRLLPANGDDLPVEVRITPISGKGERAFFVTFHDIQERKKAEDVTRAALENVQSRMGELATLRTVTETLNQASSLRNAVLPVLETVKSISKSPAVWLLLIGKAGEYHQRIEYHPLDENNLLTIENVQGDTPRCLEKLLEGRVEAPRLVKGCACSGMNSEKNHRVFPLYIGKQPLGLLNFVEDPVEPVGENKTRLLQTICDSLAVAIERVRLFKSEHDQRKLAETMRDIGTALTTSLNLNEILDLLLDQLSRLVPYDGGNVILVEDGHARITRVRGYELSKRIHSSQLTGQVFEIENTPNLKKLIGQKKTVIIPNTALDPSFISTSVSTDYHAWLGVPIIVDGRVDAVFCLDKVEPGFYTEEHAKLLSVFTTQASLAIKNATLYSSELQRINELDGLRATLADISTQLDVNTLLQEIVKRATRLLNVEIGELGLYEARDNQLRVLVSENLDPDTTGTVLRMGEGVMGRTAETRQPLSVTDYRNWPGRMVNYEARGVFSFMAVPMLAGEGELLGVIGVGDNKKERIFNDNDIRLMNLFAQQATVALRNARLFEEARRRAEEADTIRKAGAIVVSTLNQDKALRLILEQLAQVVPYDSASVLLQRDGKLQIVGGRGFRNQSAVIGMEFSLDRKNPGAVVFLENKPLFIGNIPAEVPHFNMLGKRSIIRSWLGVPLTIQNHPIGILSLDAQTEDAFSEESARLVTAFADQVAIALENARLYEDALRAAGRFETLYRVSQIITANLRLEEIYPAIHQATTELMDTEFFSISLVDEQEQTIEDVYMIDRGEQGFLSRRPLGTGLFSRAVETGKPLLFNTFDETAIRETGAVLIGDSDEDEVSQSVLVVPLKIGARVVGVLSAQSYRPNAYTETDMEELQLLAAHVAIAIENARLFSTVQELAITDPLTGLYNRRHLMELGEQEFARSTRYNRELSAVMVDCDHFKSVNDTYGHTVGDQVLKKLGDIIRTSLRQVDIIARYGGDEFMILLPETGTAEAGVIAERLRKTVSGTSFRTNAGELKFSLSVGVAGLDEPCNALTELLDRADYASYVSKDSGCDRVTTWSPTIVRNAPNNHQLFR